MLAGLEKGYEISQLLDQQQGAGRRPQGQQPQVDPLQQPGAVVAQARGMREGMDLGGRPSQMGMSANGGRGGGDVVSQGMQAIAHPEYGGASSMLKRGISADGLRPDQDKFQQSLKARGMGMGGF